MSDFRYRQIHLDFHTSEFIPDVGLNFDMKAFAERLSAASVDSITCFARCHHGWLYYPSLKHPQLVHPNLKNKNMLLEQIKACHEAGIKVPVYTTVQWDGRVMREHPEWLSVDENGEFINTQNVPPPHFYHTICLNSGYRDFFREHLDDLIAVIGPENLDGIFMDILFQVDCCCSNCKAKMKELGMDPSVKAERIRYSARMLGEFKKEITAFIRERAGDVGIFYNSSHIGPASKDSFGEYSHLELESLPSGGWGYDHFPATSRYARNLGKDMIGMTGKFHTYWGDFHSLKNRAALEFECFQMLAMGAGCSVGDQLHPGGVLSEASYDLIGDVYASVKEKEEYCKGAEPKARIAVLTPEEFYSENEYNLGLSPSLIGAVRMLQELSYQFDIIDSRMPLEKYELLILPDCIKCDEEAERRIKAFIEKGGAVIGSYDSCMKKDGSDTIYGVKYISESACYREFIRPNDSIGKSLPREDFVMYLRGHDVDACSAEILMDKIEPYFDRSGETFCSHQHAPSSGRIGSPEATRNGRAVYFAHPVFRLYRKNAARWCKEIVHDAVDLLLEKRLVSHDGPSTLIVALNTQKEKNRDILHLLHYITEKRSEDIYTIEDVIPLFGLDMRVMTEGRKPSAVFEVPSGKAVAFKQEGDYIKFVIDRLSGHGMVCIQY